MSTSKTLKTVAEIEALGFRRHHAATRRSYTPVAARGFGTPYKGRFGEGYIVAEGPHCHFGSRKCSTQYENIVYYVK